MFFLFFVDCDIYTISWRNFIVDLYSCNGYSFNRTSLIRFQADLLLSYFPSPMQVLTATSHAWKLGSPTTLKDLLRFFRDNSLLGKIYTQNDLMLIWIRLVWNLVCCHIQFTERKKGKKLAVRRGFVDSYLWEYQNFEDSLSVFVWLGPLCFFEFVASFFEKCN